MPNEPHTQTASPTSTRTLDETLGGTDRTHLFLHDVFALGEVIMLSPTMAGFVRYPERALLAARETDIVCVYHQVEESYLEFLAHLGVGLKQDSIITVPTGVEGDIQTSLAEALLQNHDAQARLRQQLALTETHLVINPYMISSQVMNCARALEKMLRHPVSVLGGPTHLVDYAKQKHHTRAVATELDIPVPQGEVVTLEPQQDGRPRDCARLQEAILRHLGQTDQVIVKGTNGSSGSSLIIVQNTAASVRQALETVAEKTDNQVYLVEVMLNVTVSPNLLMFVEPGDGAIRCVGVTDQLFSGGLAHNGNTYPSTAQTLPAMCDAAEKFSRWLRTRGYRGIVGFDFAEYVQPDTGQTNYFLAEVNPRFNAAAYPKFLMERLNRRQAQQGGPEIAAFLAVNMPAPVKSFAELATLYGPFFFHPETGTGIVPDNVGCLPYGKWSAAILGDSPEAILRMYRELQTFVTPS